MERSEPRNGVFTAAMLPDDFPAFDGTQGCADVDGDLFFPSVGNEQIAARVTRRICRDCAFQQPCAEYALRHDEDGFWGGLTSRERNVIRRRAS